MARYMVSYKQKHTDKICESDIFQTYKEAYADAVYINDLDVASVITILRDSEGEDHPDNANKFFLYRIVK